MRLLALVGMSWVWSFPVRLLLRVRLQLLLVMGLIRITGCPPTLSVAPPPFWGVLLFGCFCWWVLLLVVGLAGEGLVDRGLGGWCRVGVGVVPEVVHEDE